MKRNGLIKWASERLGDWLLHCTVPGMPGQHKLRVQERGNQAIQTLLEHQTASLLKLADLQAGVLLKAGQQGLQAIIQSTRLQLECVARRDSPADGRPVKNGHAQAIASSKSASTMLATAGELQTASVGVKNRDKEASPEKSASDEASEPEDGCATLQGASSYSDSTEAMRRSPCSKGLETSAGVSAQGASSLDSDRKARAVKIVTALQAFTSFTNWQDAMLIFCDIDDFNVCCCEGAPASQTRPSSRFDGHFAFGLPAPPPPSVMLHPLPVSYAISARTVAELLTCPLSSSNAGRRESCSILLLTGAACKSTSSASVDRPILCWSFFCFLLPACRALSFCRVLAMSACGKRHIN